MIVFLDTKVLRVGEVIRLLLIIPFVWFMVICSPFAAAGVRAFFGSPSLYPPLVGSFLINLMVATPYLLGVILPLLIFRKPGVGVFFAFLSNFLGPVQVSPLIGESFLIFLVSYLAVDIYVLLRGRNVFRSWGFPLKWNIPGTPIDFKPGYPSILETSAFPLFEHFVQRMNKNSALLLSVFLAIIVPVIDVALIVSIRWLAQGILVSLLGNVILPSFDIQETLAQVVVSIGFILICLLILMFLSTLISLRESEIAVEDFQDIFTASVIRKFRIRWLPERTDTEGSKLEHEAINETMIES